MLLEGLSCLFEEYSGRGLTDFLEGGMLSDYACEWYNMNMCESGNGIRLYSMEGNSSGPSCGRILGVIDGIGAAELSNAPCLASRHLRRDMFSYTQP